MPKPQLSAPQVAGLLCGLLGATVAVRWIFQVEAIAELIPGSRAMGIVNPILFIAIGLCFFDAPSARRASERHARWLSWASAVAIAALIALPLAYLFESATGISLGVDIERRGTLRTVENPDPGRLSPNASLAFLCAGVAFLLQRKPLNGVRNTLYVAATVVVAAVGGAGLAGHFLGLETLYKVANFNRMLPATAFGLAVVAAGLWALQEQAQAFDTGKAEARIRRRSLAVVGLVAVSCGVAGFAVMRKTFETSVSQNLLLTVSTSATSLAHAVDASLGLARTVATRPAVTQALHRLSVGPGDMAARARLQQAADGLLTAGLAGAEFRDARDTVVAAAGSMVRDRATFAFPLRDAGQVASLAWDGGYVLLSESDVVDGGLRVGRVFTAQRLPLFDALLGQVRSAGPTADAAICSRDKDDVVCAPNRLRPAGLRRALLLPDGKPSLPVVRALLGERGVAVITDSRGIDVVSAVAPIKDFGVALAVRTEVETLYGPLRSRLGYLLLALGIIISLAVYAQRSQVRPALRRLAQSEKKLKGILEEQSELVSLAKPDGELVYVNPAYARHFGRSAAQMIGANLHELVESADRGVVEATITAVLRSGRPVTSENRTASSDGTPRWVSWTHAVQRDTDGKPLLHSVGRDVTERKLAEQRLAESDRFVRQVTDSLPVRIAYVDRERRYRFVNLAHCRRFGLPREQILGRRRSELVEGGPDASVEAAVAAVLRGEPQRFEFDEWVGGKMVRFESSLIPDVDEQGAVQGFYSTGIDITEEHARKQAQERQAATLRSVSEAIPALVAVVGPEERYRFVNSSFERWIGTRREFVVGRSLKEILGPVEYERSRPWIRRVLAGETVKFEKEYAGPVRRHLAVSYIPLWLDSGEVDGFVAVAQDITEHKQEEIRLLRLTQRDPLTGLLNRAGFEQFLQSVCVESDSAQSVALLYVDLDFFKPVNDTHGHPVGDQVLQQFASRLGHAVRPTDAVARLGGDEFAVVLTGLHDEANAHAVADKIVAVAHMPFEVGALTIRIGASVGVAFGDDSGITWRRLVAQADAMLYRAKAAGRGQPAGFA